MVSLWNDILETFDTISNPNLGITIVQLNQGVSELYSTLWNPKERDEAVRHGRLFRF